MSFCNRAASTSYLCDFPSERLTLLALVGGGMVTIGNPAGVILCSFAHTLSAAGFHCLVNFIPSALFIPSFHSLHSSYKHSWCSDFKGLYNTDLILSGAYQVYSQVMCIINTRKKNLVKRKVVPTKQNIVPCGLITPISGFDNNRGTKLPPRESIYFLPDRVSLQWDCNFFLKKILYLWDLYPTSHPTWGPQAG